MKTRVMIIAATGFMAATAGLLVAGPLTPPSGPAASTYKTLSEVEPRIAINAANTPGDADSVYRITSPGSYYLTGNVAGVAGKRGIEIAASGVSIDLNGFELGGVAGALDGIAAGTNHRATVRNGSVRNWPGVGVELSLCKAIRVEDVIVTGCSSTGIQVGDDSTVDSCIANGNGVKGIIIGDGSIVSGCVANDNFGGFYLGVGAQAVHCSAARNSDSGFEADDGAVLKDCVAVDNPGTGIRVTVNACVTNCVAESNSDGIAFGSFCKILDNSSDGNVNAGYLCLVNGNRTLIKGNNATRNGQGIKVTSSNNLLLGNTCALNDVNFVVSANNHVSKIITMPFSPAINGSSGGSSISDPDANFAY